MTRQGRNQRLSRAYTDMDERAGNVSGHATVCPFSSITSQVLKASMVHVNDAALSRTLWSCPISCAEFGNSIAETFRTLAFR